MAHIQNLKPFTKFVTSIGHLPTSYLVSLTYEEQLLWYCDYIKNVLIPTINNNADCIKELQDYVQNYFDNLDVTNELKNLLDNMLKNGDLANLILDIFGNTTVMIGDSYCLGKSNGSYVKGWGEQLKDLFGLINDNCFISAESGSGFLASGENNNKFIDLLNNIEKEIPDTTLVNQVIIGGGYNDFPYTQSELNTAITSFMDRAKTIFPKAKFYLAFLGNNSSLETTGDERRQQLYNNTLPAYRLTRYPRLNIS